MIKKLIWLIKHQKDLEKLISKPVKEEKSYSLKGVPEYQLDYIKKALSNEK